VSIVESEKALAKAVGVSKRKAFLSTTQRENLEGWLFASPWILGFLIFTAGPMLAAALLAFASYDLVGRPQWIGLTNYRRLFTDDLVLTSLKVTSIYALGRVPLVLIISVSTATLLNAKIRGLQWYRTAYYLPSILPTAAVSMLWLMVFSADYGLLNLVLRQFGISGPAWLADKHWALPSMIIMSLWGFGGNMVIYLAGLQGIPTELYEAAEVDGATGLHRWRHVTLPLMTPVLFYNLVMGLVSSLQVFTQGYLMTQGGPQNATLFYVLYLYRNAFEYFKLGYAAALSWILFLYVLILTLLLFRSSSVWVFYTSEVKR
jgi:multiple sugar transport system permease protein